MLSIKLTYIQAVLVLALCAACLFIAGVLYHKTSERAAEAITEAESYQNHSDSLAQLHQQDSLLIIELIAHNNRIEASLTEIQKNYEARRHRIAQLHADSVLAEFAALRARLDSLTH